MIGVDDGQPRPPWTVEARAALRAELEAPGFFEWRTDERARSER